MENDKRRWYDKDPVLKLAVNYFEKSDDPTRDRIANYIIEEARNMGLFVTIDNFNCFWQRWQDNNMKYFEAMEYLKIIDFETKKEMSMEIIKYVESLHTEEDDEQTDDNENHSKED